jgi:hypothetical protein
MAAAIVFTGSRGALLAAVATKEIEPHSEKFQFH